MTATTTDRLGLAAQVAQVAPVAPVALIVVAALGCAQPAPAKTVGPAPTAEPTRPAPGSEPARASSAWLELDPAPAEATADVLGEGAFDGPIVATHQDADGLLIEDFAVGQGPAAQVGARVTVDYLGRLPDGTVFDSTHERASPSVFEIGRGHLIEGWERGLVGARAGMRRRLTIPPALGYGDRSTGVIPAGATLIFDIEIRRVEAP